MKRNTSAKSTGKPAKKAPVKKAPAKKAPVKKAPVKKAPAKKAPAKKAPAKKAPAKKAPAKKAPAKKAPAKKAPAKKAPAKKALAKKAAGKPVAAKKPVPVVALRSRERNKRWRDLGQPPRLVFAISRRARGAEAFAMTDELGYGDGYTGEESTITSGEPIDSGYQFYYPEEPTNTTPDNAVTAEIVIDSGTSTDPWVDYGCSGDASGTSTDEMWTDPYYVDEFIEYYEPDPCDPAYRMSDGNGSWGIVG